MKAMGDITLNASEKIQMIKARWKDLQETIGKQLINALALAAKHIDVLVAALTGAALAAASSIIMNIVLALGSLIIAARTASLAMMTLILCLGSGCEKRVIREWNFMG